MLTLILVLLILLVLAEVWTLLLRCRRGHPGWKLLRQYRYALGRVLTEIPAGKREPGEEPFLTAQREMQEEVGATAGRWTELGTLIASPGCYGETLYLYMAEDLRFGETHFDEDEFLEPLRLPLDEAVRQCMDGTLTDAKTVAAVLKGKILRER